MPLIAFPTWSRPRGAVLTLYLLGAHRGGAAVLVSYLSSPRAFLVGALALGIHFAGIVYLERAPTNARP